MASSLNSHATPQQHPSLARAGSDLASFDGRPPSFNAAPHQHQSPPQHLSYTHMAPHGQQSGLPNGSGAYRSFGEVNGNRLTQPVATPQIYTAVYSGVAVYEMEVRGIAVMRRRADSWLNATQILKVVGVDKGRRTKILEKEIPIGQHEKIQGGYGKYQGTWINYSRGREFCRQYGVEELLMPLLEHDIEADGTGLPGQGVDTPTKEQAMAANRKRFYNTNSDSRTNGQLSSGTFFSNISPMASNALAAMNKAARFDSPMPRPGSAQRRPPAGVRRPSQPQSGSQDAYISGSQQSMHSFSSEHSGGVNGQPDSAYAINSNQSGDSQEPPRKRMRPSSSHEAYGNMNGVDTSMREVSPTEPNDSFVYHQFDEAAVQGCMSLPPLPAPTDKAGEEKRLALLDLFADLSRTDYSTHTAILHLSGHDLDIPLDHSANTALHWAATLARVPLMRLLIKNGANMFVGNVVGQTPLMAAVQVKNCYDRTCFPEMLELLGPLIEYRDAAGRTILHHIALTCGVSNRGPASKYYLEALLEFTVRRGGSNPSSQPNSYDAAANNHIPKSQSIGIARFMSEIVNAQDKTGNTALNLVARIGNRTIIRQLQEVGADAAIPNNRGFKAIDFGVDAEGQSNIDGAADSNLTSSQVKSQISQVEQMKDEILAATTSILTQTQSQYATELRSKQDQLDAQNASLRDIAAQHKEELERAENLHRRAKERADREQKISNLRRVTEEQRERLHNKGIEDERGDDAAQKPEPDLKHRIDPALLALTDQSESPTAEQLAPFKLPSTAVLRARIAAYTANNNQLSARINTLKARSSELEGQYRKVVSLCTGMEEGSVEGVLEVLLAAVESEDGVGGFEGGRGSGGGLDVGRVRDFLRKVEGVGVEV